MSTDRISPGAALKTLYHFMNPARPCQWPGEHSGPPVLNVDMARPCGHSQDADSPICGRHLARELTPTYPTSTPAPCPTCGSTEPERITAAREPYKKL